MATVDTEQPAAPVEVDQPKAIPPATAFPEADAVTDLPVENVESVASVESNQSFESVINHASTVPAITETEPKSEIAEAETGAELLSSKDSLPEANAAESPEAQDEPLSARPEAPTHSQSYDPTPEPAHDDDTLSPLRSSSTSELPTFIPNDAEIAAAAPAPIRRLPSSLSSSSIDDQDISTIPDPRLRLQRLASGEKSREAADEITALSTKLIDAINHQSSLDDTLSRTRMDLEESNDKIRQLEGLVSRQKEFLAGGLWVRKSTVEEEKAVIHAKAREEKRLRMEAEAAKAKIELELETLTAELFQQANKMVTTAKEEAQAEQIEAQRRYDNLKGQLADTEGLLRSQQEQLTELKQVMEEMIKNEALARDDQTTALTTPTSPSFGQFDFKDVDKQSEKAIEASAEADAASGVAEDSSAPVLTESATPAALSPVSAATSTPAPPQLSSPEVAPQSPSQPMSFTHLLRPVLRYDTNAFHEFVDLIRTAQIQLMLQQQLMQQAHSRSPSSTSLPKTPPMNTTAWNGQQPAQGGPLVASAVPLSAMNTFASVASGLTVSSNGNSPQNHTKELKEAKFYKRVVVEDIEPTLRLDTAPGISWLVRRNIMTAILEGTLVAEPVPTTNGTASLIQSPCSMCGESRRQVEFLRQHRFRLTESDKSTPYALCNFCLGRVRSVCGFLVFLRMIKEGHWRAPDEESEQAAWEECVRLREHMFWARIGGGMLPVSGSGSHGFGLSRHSRAAGGGSSAQNSISFHANGGGSNRPSIELPSQLNTPSKININGSPLASPPLSPNHPGLGINSTSGERAVSSSTPSRPSKLSASVAAMVSGLGGHVS